MSNKKEYNELRESMMAMLDANEILYPGMEPIADWINLFTTKMRSACAEAMRNFPEGQKGPGEALMVALARFNCMVLEKFQRGGFVTDGNNAYDIFCDVLMPTAHEMVLREMAEQEEDEQDSAESLAASLATDLMDPSMTLDDIINKHFRDDMTGDERQQVRQELQSLRDTYMKKED